MNKHIGTKFDDFLIENNMLEEITAKAHKRVISMQLQKAMDHLHISKVQMAKNMHTSRSSVARLLDPNNASITLSTIDKAALALGLKLNISFS